MTSIVQTIAEPLVALLVVVGALLSAVTSFGLIRLPDVFMRSHAATKSATLGVLCVLLGAFVYFAAFEHTVSARILLAVVFIFITAPVAGHMIGRAAYRTGAPLWEKSVRDDLKEAVGAEARTELEPRNETEGEPARDL